MPTRGTLYVFSFRRCCSCSSSACIDDRPFTACINSPWTGVRNMTLVTTLLRVTVTSPNGHQVPSQQIISCSYYNITFTSSQVMCVGHVCVCVCVWPCCRLLSCCLCWLPAPKIAKSAEKISWLCQKFFVYVVAENILATRITVYYYACEANRWWTKQTF